MKKKQQNLNNSTLSLTSFDRCSERSRRRAREEVANDQAPLAFYVYYKRRDPKTIIVVMVPATCRAVLKITNKLVPRLPVLAFMVEEDRMFDIFRHSLSLPKEFKKTNVENFCARSALAHLNWQVNAKLSESERETPSPASLFTFETMEGVDPTFTDLNDFSVNIMHDLVFSRSYAQAAYHCLGTSKLSIFESQTIEKQTKLLPFQTSTFHRMFSRRYLKNGAPKPVSPSVPFRLCSASPAPISPHTFSQSGSHVTNAIRCPTFRPPHPPNLKSRFNK